MPRDLCFYAILGMCESLVIMSAALFCFTIATISFKEIANFVICLLQIGQKGGRKKYCIPHCC